MMFVENLSSRRMSMRPIADKDSELVFRNWASKSEVARYTTWRPHVSLSETQRYISRCEDSFAAGIEATYIAFLQDLTKEACNPGLEVVGSISLKPNGLHMVEVGYVVKPWFWGHGFAVEMVKSFADYLFSSTALVRLGAYCDVENSASRRVLEKVGMAFEGVLRSWAIHPNINSIPRDVCVYSLLTSDASNFCSTHGLSRG